VVNEILRRYLAPQDDINCSDFDSLWKVFFPNFHPFRKPSEGLKCKIPPLADLLKPGAGFLCFRSDAPVSERVENM